MKFYITDVFGNERYSGNQLATFMVADEISSAEMQKIAREINFSETTFISCAEPVNNGYPVRIFTPGSEIDFAGHPSLGTAYIIKRFIKGTNDKLVNLDLKVGRIPVVCEEDVCWMKQQQPVFGNEVSISTMAKMLGLNASELDHGFPVLETSTGLPFTIVPLKSLASIRKAKVDLQQYHHFIKESQAKGILIFSPEAYTSGQELSVRVFVHYLGIPEDPATGSAAGCLAAYLLKTNYLKKDRLELSLGQGFEIGRPSELKIKAIKTDEKYEIKIGGRVHHIASGDWETNSMQH